MGVIVMSLNDPEGSNPLCRELASYKLAPNKNYIKTPYASVFPGRGGKNSVLFAIFLRSPNEV